jgi:hypothetical protein
MMVQVVAVVPVPVAEKEDMAGQVDMAEGLRSACTCFPIRLDALMK